MTLALLWLQFCGVTIVILWASTYLAKSADVIAFKTGLGRAFIGVVLLATATSLPELATGVSSIALVGAPDLAAGDAFGSNLFNLFIIGLLDIFWRQGPILNSVSTSLVVVSGLGMAVICLAALGIFTQGSTIALPIWYVSPISVMLLIVFLGSIYVIYRFESSKQRDANSGSKDNEHPLGSLSRAVWIYVISAVVVVVAATWLAHTGDRVAMEMGWEASYVGTQFLALSTSLPELAASFVAIRIGAPELAISNVLGSNLFNMGIVLFVDDLAMAGGGFWTAISQIHAITAVLAVLMTSVVIVALMSRQRDRPGTFWTVEAVLLVGLYAVASVLVFYLG